MKWVKKWVIEKEEPRVNIVFMRGFLVEAGGVEPFRIVNRRFLQPRKFAYLRAFFIIALHICLVNIRM